MYPSTFCCLPPAPRLAYGKNDQNSRLNQDEAEWNGHGSVERPGIDRQRRDCLSTAGDWLMLDLTHGADYQHINEGIDYPVRSRGILDEYECNISGFCTFEY